MQYTYKVLRNEDYGFKSPCSVRKMPVMYVYILHNIREHSFNLHYSIHKPTDMIGSLLG